MKSISQTIPADSSSPGPSRMWNALYTAPSKETDVAAYLSSCGLETLCPVVTERVRKKIRGRNAFVLEDVVFPLFRRYVFSSASPRIYDLLFKLPDRLGGIKVVRCGEEASVLDDETVAALMVMGELIVPDDLAHLEVGTKVRLDTLSGLAATIVSVAGLISEQEITVRFKMLGRWKELAVPALSVEPV